MTPDQLADLSLLHDLRGNIAPVAALAALRALIREAGPTYAGMARACGWWPRRTGARRLSRWCCHWFDSVSADVQQALDAQDARRAAARERQAERRNAARRTKRAEARRNSRQLPLWVTGMP